GSLTLNDGADADNLAVSANGTGNVLLWAEGANTDLTANADVLSGAGHVTVRAARSLTFTANADLTTSGAGTINVEAGTGSLTLSTTSNQTTGFGDVRFLAAVDLTLGGLVNTAGSVSLTATNGTIFDGDTDGSVDIVANGLRLVA